MPELAEWDSFYVIVGSSAGALIGLQFVVLTLIADRPVKGMEQAGAAFVTPTIIHFAAALLLSVLVRVPWPSAGLAATVWGLPTSAVPAPPRTRPTPAHRFGLISSLSLRPP